MHLASEGSLDFVRDIAICAWRGVLDQRVRVWPHLSFFSLDNHGWQLCKPKANKPYQPNPQPTPRSK
jgi:hypothetical protein